MDIFGRRRIKRPQEETISMLKLTLYHLGQKVSLPPPTLYRNDFNQSNIRTCYRTAVYTKNDLNCTETPYRFNVNNVKIIVTVLSHPVPNIHVVGIYQLKTVRISQFIEALTHLHKAVLIENTIPAIVLVHLNINLMQEIAEQKASSQSISNNKQRVHTVNYPVYYWLPYTNRSHLYKYTKTCAICRYTGVILLYEKLWSQAYTHFPPSFLKILFCKLTLFIHMNDSDAECETYKLHYNWKVNFFIQKRKKNTFMHTKETELFIA